jgi:hypothetical protein
MHLKDAQGKTICFTKAKLLVPAAVFLRVTTVNSIATMHKFISNTELIKSNQ